MQSMSKSARQALIRGLLRKGPIASQSSLARALERAGFSANQGTISRDLRELGVIKTSEGYRLAGDSPAQKPKRTLRLEHVYQVAVSTSFVVLRTPPGMASPTAVELDHCGRDEILGTIAGDDTIFVATADEKRAKALCKTFRALLQDSRKRA